MAFPPFIRRFRNEQIELAGSSGGKDENDIPGPGRKVRILGRQQAFAPRGCEAIQCQQTPQAKSPQTPGKALQEPAPILQAPRNRWTSCGVGGTPIKSRLSRLISVVRSASGEGWMPFSWSRARTKASIGLRTQAVPSTLGSGGRRGGRKAQCLSRLTRLKPQRGTQPQGNGYESI